MPCKHLNYKRKITCFTNTAWYGIKYICMQMDGSGDKLPQKRLMTIRDFLQIYSISRTKFYDQMRTKAIDVIKLGSRTYISVAQAEAWLLKISIRPVEPESKKKK